MRFKFCGDIEPPEWFFSEVNMLSRLNSVRIKLISLQIAKKIARLDFDLQKAWKMSADSGLNRDEIQSAFAAVHFIFTSACKFDVSSNVLSEEIAQLGIPQENAVSLGKVYAENFSAMNLELQKTFVRINRFQKIDWKVDYDLVTRNTFASMKVGTDRGEQPLVMSSAQINLLAHELLRAKDIMQRLQVRDS